MYSWAAYAYVWGGGGGGGGGERGKKYIYSPAWGELE